MFEGWLLLLGGVEIVLGGLMTAYPNLLPQWVGLLIVGIGLLTILFAVNKVRNDTWQWIIGKAQAQYHALHPPPSQGHIAGPQTPAAVAFQVSLNNDVGRIDDHQVALALLVRKTGPDFDDGMAFLEQMNVLRPEGMSLPLALRTEEQIRDPDSPRGRRGRWRLTGREPATIPVLYVNAVRKNEWVLIDEALTWHVIPAQPLSLVVGIYGGGSSQKVLVRVSTAEGWQPSSKIEDVADDFVLPPRPPATLPPTLIEVFSREFPETLKVDCTFNYKQADGSLKKITGRQYAHMMMRTSFVGFYVPRLSTPVPALLELADLCATVIEQTNKGLSVAMRSPGDTRQTELGELVFSGRVYIYYDGPLTLQSLAEVERAFTAKSLSVQIRDETYATGQWLQKLREP